MVGRGFDEASMGPRWALLLLVPLAASALLVVVPPCSFISMSFHENLGDGRIGRVVDGTLEPWR